MPNHIKEPHTIVFYFLRMITKNDLWAMRTYVHIYSQESQLIVCLDWLSIYKLLCCLQLQYILPNTHVSIIFKCKRKAPLSINNYMQDPIGLQILWPSLFDQPSMDPTLQSTNCNFFNQLSCMDLYWLHGHDHCMGSCALPSPQCTLPREQINNCQLYNHHHPSLVLQSVVNIIIWLIGINQHYLNSTHIGTSLMHFAQKKSQPLFLILNTSKSICLTFFTRFPQIG